MISCEEYDQLKQLHAAVTASSVQQGFIGADKEILLLSSIIYRLDCITFLDATQLRGSWRHRGDWDLWLFCMLEINITSKKHLLGSRLLRGGWIHWLAKAGTQVVTGRCKSMQQRPATNILFYSYLQGDMKKEQSDYALRLSQRFCMLSLSEV